MWTTLKHQAGVNLRKPQIYRVTQLQFKSYEQWKTGLAARRAKVTLDLLGINNRGPIPMPLYKKRWNWLVNPFKWKKHQELWEIRTASSIITFESDITTTELAMEYIHRRNYPGVEIRVRKLSFEPIEKYYKSPYAHLCDINETDRIKKLRKSKAEKLLLMGRPVSTTENSYNVLRINQYGEYIEEKVGIVDPITFFNIDEPEVLDEDIVFDDTDFRFLDPYYNIFRKEEFEQIVKRLSTLTGLEFKNLKFENFSHQQPTPPWLKDKILEE